MILKTFVLAGHITYILNNIFSKILNYKKIDKFKVNVFYNSVLIFSKMQHLLLKLNKHTNNKIPKLIKYISKLTRILNDDYHSNNNIELYKNGRLILKTNDTKLLENISNYNLNDTTYDYDLAIINSHSSKCNECLNNGCEENISGSLNNEMCNVCNNEGITLKKIYSSSSEKINNISQCSNDNNDNNNNNNNNDNSDNQFIFGKPVSYKFILFEIIIGDLSINIDLNSKNNYLLYGNKIDKDFILYFLNKYHKEEIKNLDETTINNYKIRLIDENINMNEYDSNAIIFIDKHKYNIVNK